MLKISKCLESSEGNVWKYIFESADAIIEAVLYRYDDFMKRTVLCVSVQSGCPVGCTFCGTGKKFIRNLTESEIINQVWDILKDRGLRHIIGDAERFQIMFMSMGEPLLNFNNVKNAIQMLSMIYPNAELLLSTIGVNDHDALGELLSLSKSINRVGLQFSIHEAFEKQRNELIPFSNKMSLKKIRDYGIVWNRETGRPVYLNYCVTDENSTDVDIEELQTLFSPVVFNFTFSVVCSDDENMKDKGYRNYDQINKVIQSFIKEGYNTRMFDPAGQDDIGGGCGQLWHVQDWMKKHDKM